MSEYYLTGPKARQMTILPGVTVVDDWKDGTFNVKFEEEYEDNLVEQCEENGVEAQLL